jgi:hypothetical protein
MRIFQMIFALLFVLPKRRWETKRMLKKLGINYQYAAELVQKQYEGQVVDDFIEEKLNDFYSNPCLKTAADLLIYQPEKTAWVAFASQQGFSTGVWEREQ